MYTLFLWHNGNVMQDYLSIVMVKKMYLVHIYDNGAFI
jgi:hypothetical protein